MNNQHPITPPPELVQQWREESSTGELHFSPQYLAVQAARWGSDQELEACCAWVDSFADWGDLLLQDRRPKPPSLKEQALDALREAESTGCLYVNGRSDLIRRALEALPND